MLIFQWKMMTLVIQAQGNGTGNTITF